MNKMASGKQTVLWWVLWITGTIASFFVAHAIWTPWIAEHFGSVRETKTAVIWVTAVFGTWMIILVPMIVVMYSKVDKAYEDARLRREKLQNQFRSISVDKNKRLLSSELSEKISPHPQAIEGGHLITAILKDGRRIENVFVQEGNEIIGIYDAREMKFDASDVADIEMTDLEKLPPFETTSWLRLDGVTAPE